MVSRKSKTYEEIFGIERALVIKTKLSLSHKNQISWNKGLKMGPQSEEHKNKRINLPYKFVGDGKFFIANKCPDFINSDGRKIAIEVYYTKHKEYFHKLGLKGWMAERKKIFKEKGWSVIFFNEVEVNEEVILKRLNN